MQRVIYEKCKTCTRHMIHTRGAAPRVLSSSSFEVDVPPGWLHRRPVLLAPASATAVPSKHTCACLRARAALMLTASEIVCLQVMPWQKLGGAAGRIDPWPCGVAILATARMATPHRVQAEDTGTACRGAQVCHRESNLVTVLFCALTCSLFFYCRN